MKFWIKILLASIGAIISLSSFMANPAFAVTISDTVNGSVFPPTLPVPNTVTNGDFVIGNATRGNLVGDGADETTSWTFDFTDSLGDISPSATLESANLTLTITPGRRK